MARRRHAEYRPCRLRTAPASPTASCHRWYLSDSLAYLAPGALVVAPDCRVRAPVQDMRAQDIPGSSRGWPAGGGSCAQPVHSNWGEQSPMGGTSAASQRLCTPQFNSTGTPHAMNMHGGGHAPAASAPLMRRINSGGQPSWLQSGVPAARVSSASMDVFAATGASGSWVTFIF